MKIPWVKPIAVGILLLLAIASIHYVAKRLPPSKVNLVFKGWKKVGTNKYAHFDLTNEGPRSIYWEHDGAILIETQSGWVTNIIEHFTYVTIGTPPASSEPASLKIPATAKKWMICLYYTSYERHQWRRETGQKLIASGFAGRHPQIFDRSKWFWEFLAWGASWFPHPKEEYHQVFSQIFTNQPPDQLVDLKKTH